MFFSGPCGPGVIATSLVHQGHRNQENSVFCNGTRVSRMARNAQIQWESFDLEEWWCGG